LQGDDVQWAVGNFAPGREDDFSTVLLFGNEDSPCQVWASSRVALRTFDEMERIA
jgi:3'-phosphoadenosine 5'-phosphosulfate sulfotransferase